MSHTRRRCYPLTLEARYRVSSKNLVKTGLGQTMLIGDEVVFTAEQNIEAGAKLELAIAWPVLLDGHVRLQLKLEGTVTYSSGRLVISSVSNYQFRTLGPVPGPPAAAIAIRGWSPTPAS